jgi:hypothetical protein
MSSWYPWSHNPARKYFGIVLANHWGYELKLHSKYPSKSFGAAEKSVIKSAITELPESPLQLLLYRILETLGPPPEELIIKSFLIKPRREKVPKSYRIMVDAESFNAISGLTLMGMETRAIRKQFEAMLLPPNYRLEHIDRFRYQFWNVKEEEGWDIKCNKTLQNMLLSDPDLTESFHHLLDGALSDKNRRDIAMHYSLSLSASDRTREYLRASDSAILLQNKKMEIDDLQGADLAANIVSKTVNSGAKLGITPTTIPTEKTANLLDK